jgi:hypothetical protein
VYEEIQNITKIVLDCSKDFFIPTTIESTVVICDDDYSANGVFKGLCGPYDRIKCESDTGVFFNDFSVTINNETTPKKIRYIRCISIENGKFRFF